MPDFDYKAFGRLVRAIRESENLRQKELAREIDITERYLRDIELHGRVSSAEVIFAISTRLNIPLDQFLFPNKENKKSPTRIHVDHNLDQLNKKELNIIESTINALIRNR